MKVNTQFAGLLSTLWIPQITLYSLSGHNRQENVVVHLGNRRSMGIINIVLDETLSITYFEKAVPIPGGSPRILHYPIPAGIVIPHDYHRVIYGCGTCTCVDTTRIEVTCHIHCN